MDTLMSQGCTIGQFYHVTLAYILHWHVETQQTCEHSFIIHWTTWPAMGRCALHTTQSLAVSHATSATSPVQTSSCCIHGWRGRPRRRFHCGLLSGRWPVLALTARCSAMWAGVTSGSRLTWPNITGRRLVILSQTLSWPVRFMMVALVAKWLVSSLTCCISVRNRVGVWFPVDRVRVTTDLRRVRDYGDSISPIHSTGCQYEYKIFLLTITVIIQGSHNY